MTNLNRTIERVLKEWLDRDLPTLRIDAPVHLHTDELAKRSVWAGTLLDLLFAAYPIAIDLLMPQIDQLMPLLMLPLRTTETMSTKVPEIACLGDDLSAEPPSIYVVQREVFSSMRLVETYRCPLLDFQPFETRRDDVVFFYEISRSEQHRQWGWEYGRKICAEQYPAWLRPNRYWRATMVAWEFTSNRNPI